MIKHSRLQVIFFSFLLVSCASIPGNAQPEDPAFIVITKNPDDQVDIQYENGTSLIEIESPTGIGSATFELESGSMPTSMALRFHLTGLEEFRLTFAQDRISASASSGNQTLLSSGTETPLLPGHPLWMEIKIVSDASGKIPLKDGYFEVILPQEFLQKTGRTFEIEWIDFYR